MNNTRELTFRVVFLSIFLTIILALSNAYLALKIGMLTSASIPAAILSMGILRFFKNSTLLENNLVQTAASAGEAVAGGVVYSVPALILIHYWFGFSYWENFCFAFIGGALGVLFSIPLRRFLVTDKNLPFPEGAAIAEVLKMSGDKTYFQCMLKGGAVGGFIELCQTGFKVIASQWEFWIAKGSSVVGFGVGFSPTLIGAGYLIGFNIGLSIIIGALLSWIIGLPLISQFFPDIVQQAKNSGNILSAVGVLWGDKIRYIAIGMMLTAGLGMIFALTGSFVRHLRKSLRSWETEKTYLNPDKTPVNHHDMPWHWNVFGMVILSIGLMIFFWRIFPFELLGLNAQGIFCILFLALVLIFIVGFVFSGITGYFSGLVGVSASPGSSVIIAGLLFIGCVFLNVLHFWIQMPWTDQQTIAAEAVAIMVAAIITSIAAIANDNIQDLKVGHILNATPWKQQVMLLLGVLVSALVIPPVMQILFDVYGIGDVLPRAGMDPLLSLPAPPAAMIAGLTQAVFSHQLPWSYLLIGVALGLGFFMIRFLVRNTRYPLSVLGVGVGMYLPLSSTVPLFIGGLIAKHYGGGKKGTLLACGLLAGSALMDVLLAVPFAMASSPDVFKLIGTGDYWKIITPLFGVGIWLLCVAWFRKLHFGEK